MLDGRENYTSAQTKIQTERQNALDSFTKSSAAQKESDSEDSDDNELE